MPTPKKQIKQVSSLKYIPNYSNEYTDAKKPTYNLNWTKEEADLYDKNNIKNKITESPWLYSKVWKSMSKEQQQKAFNKNVAERKDYELVKDVVMDLPQYVAPIAGMEAAAKFISKIPAVKRIGKYIGKKIAPEITENVIKQIEVPKQQFKSEIDWAKWNKEIPENKALMQEYNAIEQQTKADGTWMKNPDGSTFQGTPEQFVQQNSENFKKAFPEYGVTYRGDRTHYPELDYNPIFTGDKKMALNYTNENAGYWGPNHTYKANSNIMKPNDGGLHELYYDKRRLKIDIDAKNRDYTELKLDEIAGDDYISTDDVARRIASGNMDAIIRNVYDGSSHPGTVRIINHNYGSNNFMKSARGNNGMFDMTNPNIYKSLLPIIGGSTLLRNKISYNNKKKSINKFNYIPNII